MILMTDSLVNTVSEIAYVKGEEETAIAFDSDAPLFRHTPILMISRDSNVSTSKFPITDHSSRACDRSSVNVDR